MAPRPRNMLSLCAGGGGLDLGIMLAEPDARTVCFVEWEEYPRECLIAAQEAGYMHPAPIWDNVRTFDGRPYRGSIDTITGGYPCQPFSAAGSRKGADDPRHLWPDFARIIDEIRPTWCIFENVAGHLSLGFEDVHRQLSELGYDVACCLASAAEVGFAHKRERIFIVGHAKTKRWAEGRAEPETRQRRSAVTKPSNAMGHADNPQREGPSGGCDELADASGTKPQGIIDGSYTQRRENAGGHAALQGRAILSPPKPTDATAWQNVLASAPNLAPAISIRDAKRYANKLSLEVESGAITEKEAQSAICRMVDGLAGRSRALQLLGNGVCPLAAANAIRACVDTLAARAMDMEGKKTAPE